MDEQFRRLTDSARRLNSLLTGNAPAAVIRGEFRLMVGFAAGLYGPGVIRTWVDDLVTRTAALLACPDGVDCGACAGLGRLFTSDGEDPQCGRCAGTGVVPPAGKAR